MHSKKNYGQIIMGCLLTGIHDVNRNTVLQNDDYSLIKDWADSIIALNLQGIIFHNTFSAETCLEYENKNIHFIRITHDASFNPNVYRYFIYNDFLKEHTEHVNQVFCTDVSDVVLLKNPFEQTLFFTNPNQLFCGDEPKKLNTDWMKEHASHLRNNITDYAAYEETFKDEALLNCGIIGGGINVMKEFIGELANIHELYNHSNQTAFTGDMGAFNYLARTKYNNNLLHGTPVNTVFKAYDNSNNECWFKHK
ncbi:MAG: hypothetical protein ACKVOM_08830 [Ferruginibacter sp.]